MKYITYIPYILFLGEYCRVLVVGRFLYIAVSRERKRINIDLTLNF